MTAIEFENRPKQYLLGLNGLRFIAALVLLLGHIGQSDFCDWGRQMPSLPLPDLCAYLFFVISGVLSGYRASSTRSVAAFYKKKAKRVLPVYYSYLFVVVLCFIVMGRKSEVLNASLWYYVIPVGNIPFCQHNGIIPLVHLWYVGTLVEFYLVFPWLAKLNEKRLLKVSIVICVGWALVKWMIYLFVGKDTSIYSFFASSSFDSLFLGVVLGILLKNDEIIIKRIANNNFIALLTWLLFISFGFYGHIIPAPVRVEFFAILSAFLIIGQETDKPIVSLENGFWNWLGSISYEFYVYQILIIILISQLLSQTHSILPIVLIYVVCVVMVMIVALGVNRLIKLVEDYGNRNRI